MLVPPLSRDEYSREEVLKEIAVMKRDPRTCALALRVARKLGASESEITAATKGPPRAPPAASENSKRLREAPPPPPEDGEAPPPPPVDGVFENCGLDDDEALARGVANSLDDVEMAAAPAPGAQQPMAPKKKRRISPGDY